MSSTCRIAGSLLAAALVAACGAGPSVRSVGTGGAEPAYELRGGSLAALHAEAARLCARGYAVLRQAQQYAPARPDDSGMSQWLQQAGDWLAGMPGNRAQATVQCHA